MCMKGQGLMMKQIDWNKICRCNKDSLEKMSSYVESLIELRYEVEQYGILGFNHFLDEKADAFETFATGMVTQGTMPELCENILSNVLNSSDFDDDVYLKNAIYSEFVLAVQIGNMSDQELRMRLYSYLGIESIGKIVYPHRL